MKKLLLIFVSTLLLGSSSYAQVTSQPDLTDYPGAKKILADVQTLNFQGITLEQAIQEDIEYNKFSIYSPANVADLMRAAIKIKNLNISTARYYLSVSKKIMEILVPEYSNEGSLVLAQMGAEKELSERPLKSLLIKLQNYNLASAEDFKNPTTKTMLPVIKNALQYFIKNTNYCPYDIAIIVGIMDGNECEDGLLPVAFKIMGKNPSAQAELEPLVYAVQMLVLCNDVATTNAEYFMSYNKQTAYSKSAKALINGLKEEDFSLKNTALVKIVKAGDIGRGLANFNHVMKLIEKK